MGVLIPRDHFPCQSYREGPCVLRSVFDGSGADRYFQVWGLLAQTGARLTHPELSGQPGKSETGKPGVERNMGEL